MISGRSTRSPVSDDGRGLKQQVQKAGGIAGFRSPVSDDGRGLKQDIDWRGRKKKHRSPVSDDGRGLKQTQALQCGCAVLVRPSVMTGVD